MLLVVVLVLAALGVLVLLLTFRKNVGEFAVRPDTPERQAEVTAHFRALLATINAFLDAHPGDAKIQRIRQRWNGTLRETPAHESDIAYSVGKDVVYLCARDRETGELELLNDSMYVALHELAHIATREYGHTPAFWDTFRYLLELADASGHYTYSEHPGKYCGMPLGANIMTCVRNGSCPSLL